MGAVVYILIGFIIGFGGLFLLANHIANKENQKLDDSLKSDVKITTDNPNIKIRFIPSPKNNKPNIHFIQPDFEKIENQRVMNDWMKKWSGIISGQEPIKEKTLEEQLQDAIENEEYEIAAKLRDKIKTIK
jgi:excinuclease UvrABC helicase subunit UvrB